MYLTRIRELVRFIPLLCDCQVWATYKCLIDSETLDIYILNYEDIPRGSV